MEPVVRTVSGLALAACMLALSAAIASAGRMAPPPTGIPRQEHLRQQPTSWRDRDTASYVLSTINLLNTSAPDVLTRELGRSSGIVQFAVFQDRQEQTLFYIRLLQSGGHVAGALAYRYGWVTSRGLTVMPSCLEAARAPQEVLVDYKHGPMRLLGVYSALPGA